MAEIQQLMQPEWELLTPPSAEPISIVEAKLQCRRPVDMTNEDEIWAGVISAARNTVEKDARRAICWQRWKMSLDTWPTRLFIYRCPLIEVESVQYTDWGGTQQTLSESNYIVSKSEPARIAPSMSLLCWPATACQLASVQVTFTAGYLIPFTADASTDTLTFIDYEPTNGDKFRLTNSGGFLPSPLVAKRDYYIVGASGNTCQLSTTSGGSAVDLTAAGTGLQFLGELPGAAKQAMLKHIAVNFADREGSSISAACQESYMQSLRPIQYTVL